MLLYLFYGWQNKTLGKLSKLMQPLSSESGVRTQAAWFPELPVS